jgi:hypothetical protein
MRKEQLLLVLVLDNKLERLQKREELKWQSKLMKF